MPTDMISRSPRLPALALLLIAVAWPATAQDPDRRDLQALRFYIEEDNQDAIQSELRRLQIQFPAWEPPADLSTLTQDISGAAVDRIYQLIAEGNHQEAREAIAQTERDYPDWSPSADLLSTLSLAERQAAFDAAVTAGNRQAVIRIARSTPELLRCERVNNAWLLAEQYAAMNDPDAAFTVYRGVSNSCENPDILIATLEKAAAVASAGQIGDLADTMRSRVPAASQRFSTVENRLRAGLGASPRNLPGSTRPTGAPSSEPQDAETTITADMRPKARPTTLGQPAVRPTVRAASKSRRRSDGASVSSRVARAAGVGDWQTCLALTAKATQAALVSQRGWCAFNAGRPMQALRDFKVAAARGGTASLRRDSAYGMALTMMRLDMVNQAAAVAASTDFTRDQRLEIESEILDARGVAAFNRGEYGQAISYFNELERLTGTVRRDLALLRGYAYLNSGRRGKAVTEFRKLHNQLATPETRSALSTALR
ncbi:hypothetical protein [Salipiger mucosus]|uniref:Tetratricopeptide repeat protein n=1 Tax=Salipiger mucosus DSM 16094 TaxID=1123237 RepID=S9Q6M6_9RHOB|nr:hypothetical protein [Salipiger mucosus]EPX75657.1 hypothetical protein Salmuc_04575 [Salipiger mucosus DSM 16094]